MTAFARATEDFHWGTATWEIRSVNHRYLEPSIRLNDNDQFLEQQLRKRLQQQLHRGKIDCTLKVQLNHTAAVESSIDHKLLRQLIQQSDSIAIQFKRSSAPTTLDILKWPGILHEQTRNSEEQNEHKIGLFQAAINQLIDCRRREGKELQNNIESRLEIVETIISAIHNDIPNVIDTQRKKIKERINNFKVDMDPVRVEQEIILLIQKADISEEIDRLNAHINEAKRVLSEGGACGRRLDFLMQEFNREINTIASKSNSSNISSAAIELKVLTEQMREQIQNIE